MSLIKRKKNIKLELWLFILMVFLLTSVIAGAQELADQGEKYLQRFSICKDIIEKNPVLEKNFFTSQDEKVVAWIRFSYSSANNFKLYWEWISPQGKLHHRGEVEMEAGKYHNYRTWYWIKIKENYSSKLVGEWKVKVYINQILLDEKNFFVIE